MALLAAWAEANSPAGNGTDAPPKKKWADRWTIPAPDLEIKMAEPVNIPADGDVDYTYEILPTHFKECRWVQSSEILPCRPEHVHHSEVDVRPPASPWLLHAPL